MTTTLVCVAADSSTCSRLPEDCFGCEHLREEAPYDLSAELAAIEEALAEAFFPGAPTDFVFGRL